MNLGNALRKCRKLQRKTLEELALLTNMSISYISLLEQNKREPTLSSLNSIASALKIPLSVIIILAAEDNDINELSLDTISNLTASVQDLISDVSVR